MQDIVRSKLAELVGRFGLDLCNDTRRCEALLRDVCGDRKREIVALVTAARDGVGNELRQASAAVPKELIIARLAKRLHENFGLVEDLARWAVESWAVALGVAAAGAHESIAAAGTMYPWSAGKKTRRPKAGEGRVIPDKTRKDSFAPRKRASPAIQSVACPREKKTVDLGNGVKLEMLLIPAGEFLMGSPDSDRYAAGDEKPRHRVRITRPFYLGKYPVTQEQWEAVMGGTPSKSKGPNNPVEQVSWDDCQQFCEKLNARFRPHPGPLPEGEGEFRLPSEAQWEYACRAGSTTRYCFGNDRSELREYAWCHAGSDSTTRPVGGKKPNAWGLYDMHGNVWEWCQDWYNDDYYADSLKDDPTGPRTGSSRVFRGGGWHRAAGYCRSALRDCAPPGTRLNFLGLRVCLVPAEKPAERA